MNTVRAATRMGDPKGGRTQAAPPVAALLFTVRLQIALPLVRARLTPPSGPDHSARAIAARKSASSPGSTVRASNNTSSS